MKKLIVLFLVLLLVAVPVSAGSNLVQDDAGLLTDYDVENLEEIYSRYTEFTPALVTTDSFGGLSAEEFAGEYYDIMDYPEDGILLLVSLKEGQWYILTNGECYRRIPDWDVESIGQELVPMIKDGTYYAAFLRFPELAAEAFEANAPVLEDAEDTEAPAPIVRKKSYRRTIAKSMGIGMLIGLAVVAVMSFRMKSVRRKNSASDYVRPGSMRVTSSRDIFLYSHVHRSAKPKNNSSGGRSGGGGSRGGAGGRL